MDERSRYLPPYLRQVRDVDRVTALSTVLLVCGNGYDLIRSGSYHRRTAVSRLQLNVASYSQLPSIYPRSIRLHREPVPELAVERLCCEAGAELCKTRNTARVSFFSVEV